jgi:hypothetical protein
MMVSSCSQEKVLPWQATDTENHGNLNAPGSVREVGSAGICDASEAVLGAFQSHDRLIESLKSRSIIQGRKSGK